jgi:16S rRNA (adenine1518-N6/adenine1519-N6)-dimethyltransferase
MSETPQTKKSLGQHWLYDEAALQAMCRAAGVTPGDTVLEIGPGTGTLTAQLLQAGASVEAVELDQDRLAGLRAQFAGQPFRLHQQSILKFDLTTLPPGYKVVANIPYYLTSNLVRLLSETPNPPQTAVLLVQKEVAERVAAAPGAMSLLSVTAQYYWEVSLDMMVPARLFTPPPKVDSQILVLHRRQAPLFTDIDTKQLFWLVKAGYSSRRKTLHNSLRPEANGASAGIVAAGLVCIVPGVAPSILTR